MGADGSRAELEEMSGEEKGGIRALGRETGCKRKFPKTFG